MDWFKKKLVLYSNISGKSCMIWEWLLLISILVVTTDWLPWPILSPEPELDYNWQLTAEENQEKFGQIRPVNINN